MQGRVESHLARPRIPMIVAVLVVFGAITFRYSQTVADADLWGHVRFGQDILDAGMVVRYDPYAYVPEGQPWINHEWLSEVIFALLFRRWGATGLVILKLSLGMLTMGIIYLRLVRCELSTIRALIVLLLTVLPLVTGLGTIRPHLFTYFCFTATIYILGAFERSRSPTLWLLVPIFGLWANLHGGFLAGIAVLLLWFLARSVEAVLRRKTAPMIGRHYLSQLLAPTLAALLVTLVNPYGPGLWTFLWRTALVARPEITEWGALQIVSPLGLAYLLVLALTVAGLLFSRRRRSPAPIAVYAVMALMPLVAVRHMPLFAVAAVMIAAEHVGDTFQRRATQSVSLPAGQVLCLALAAITAMTVISWPRVSRIEIPRNTFPVRAVQYIKEHVHSRARLAIDFNWGEYAIWHLGPTIQVSLDGRRETVYDEQAYQMSLNLHFGMKDWDQLLEQYETDLALVSKDRAVYNLLLLRPDWELVYEDPLCALFVNDQSAISGQVRGGAVPDVPYDGGGQSFPYGSQETPLRMISREGACCFRRCRTSTALVRGL